MFYFFIISKIIESFFYILLPVLAKIEMDQLVEKNEQLFWLFYLDSYSIFLVILLIIFCIKLLESFIQWFISIIEYDYIKKYDNYFLEWLYEKLSLVEPWLFLNDRNKRFIRDVFSESSRISGFIREFIWKFTSSIITLIWIITVLAIINIYILLIIFLSGFILYFISKLKEKINHRYDFEDKYEYDWKIWKLTQQLQENFTNLLSSWWFKLLRKYLVKYNEQITYRTKMNSKKNLFYSILTFITENITEIWIKLIVWWAIFFSTASVWTMTMALLYINRLQDFISDLWYSRFRLNNFFDQLLKLDLFLNLCEWRYEKKLEIKKFNKISFKNVSFQYPSFYEQELKYLNILENRIKSYSSKWEYEKKELHLIKESREQAKIKNENILNNVNLTFETWKTYWIVWKNWAWKTTLVSLILWHFDSFWWDLFFDNYDSKEFSRDFFWDNISVINQVPYILEEFSIRDNLLLWVNKKYTDEEIFSLLDKFSLKNKITKLYKKLDSIIWMDINFSWWEKQLLVIIRILLQDKKIIIMDEWTNQLDAEKEIFVMEEILKNNSDKIIIFITHRMTTIRKSDIIYCLDNKTITEYGNHIDLLKYDNIYSYFWKKQVW